MKTIKNLELNISSFSNKLNIDIEVNNKHEILRRGEILIEKIETRSDLSFLITKNQFKKRIDFIWRDGCINVFIDVDSDGYHKHRFIFKDNYFSFSIASDLIFSIFEGEINLFLNKGVC